MCAQHRNFAWSEILKDFPQLPEEDREFYNKRVSKDFENYASKLASGELTLSSPKPYAYQTRSKTRTNAEAEAKAKAEAGAKSKTSVLKSAKELATNPPVTAMQSPIANTNSRVTPSLVTSAPTAVVQQSSSALATITS